MARFAFGKNKKRLEESDKHLHQGSESPKSSDNSIKADENAIPNSVSYGSSSIRNQFAPNLATHEAPWKRYKLLKTPFPRYRHSAAQIASDKNEIFLMGGLKDGSVYGDTWKIMPKTNESRDIITGYAAQSIEVANLNNPPARVGHASTLCGNAYVIFGGDTVDTDLNGFPDNNFYLFNINNSKYTIPSHVLGKPNGRYGHSIGVVSLNSDSSKLYLFGGQLENDVYNDIYYFELNSFKSSKAKWNLIEPLNNFKPPPMTNHSMSIYKSKIYIFGGVYNNEKVSNDLWCFDVLINKWIQVNTTGDIPPPVNEHASCIVDDKLYIYGGNDFSGIIYDTMYVLDIHSFKWTKLSSAGSKNGPGPRCGHSMTYLPKFHKILILGGDKNDFANNDASNFETHELYDGNDYGTIIYEFDLNLSDCFFYGRNIVEPKKIASSAKHNDGRNFSSREAESSSTALDDFRTPNASPVPVMSNYLAGAPSTQDKFVDVDIPSTINTEVTDSRTDQDLLDYNKNGDVHEDFYREENSDDINQSYANGNHLNQFNGEYSKAMPPASEDNSKLKNIVSGLTSQLNDLRDSTQTQMYEATAKISALELENKSLKERDLVGELEERDQIIASLKASLSPSDLDTEAKDTSTMANQKEGITELTKYRLEKIELKNKLIYLEEQNNVLNAKLSSFEPFMNNQIDSISDLQKVIKSQEDKISLLTSQLKEQEPMIKEKNEWMNKFHNLELEFNNFKSLHSDDIIEDEDVSGDFEASDKSVITLGSSRKSRREISTHLANLVELWSSKNEGINASLAKDSPDNDDKEKIRKLQEQVDQLLKIGKEQETGSQIEIDSLKLELESRLQSMNTFEENYRDALLSVNKTSKALKLTQEELKNQRANMEKLQKENNELMLYKKASRRVSSRGVMQNNSSLGSNDSMNNDIITSKSQEEDEEQLFSSAHFNMKLKDIEADMFVIKQERDQLKDQVTSLKKELFLVKQGDCD